MKKTNRANSQPGGEAPAASDDQASAPQGAEQPPGQPLSADVFISYSRKDIAFARLLRAALHSSGLESWIDWERIPVGEKWWAEICQAIERSNVFLFIISASSIGSSVCRDEVNEALKNHKRVIPVLVDNLTPEAVHKFVPELPELNWVIFEKDNLFQLTEDPQVRSGPPEDRLVALPNLPQFEEALAKLTEAVHTDWDWVKSHTQLQVDALRWSAKDRDASYLFGGSALEDAQQWLSRAFGRDPQPTPLQSEFISAGRLEEARRQRETSRRQRRLLRVIGTALVVTAALGCVALVQRSDAQRQATAALSGELAAESSNYLGTQFDVGSLLAVQSWNTLDSYTSRNSLLLALQAWPRLKGVLWTPYSLGDIVYSPDGKLLAGTYCAADRPVQRELHGRRSGHMGHGGRSAIGRTAGQSAGSARVHARWKGPHHKRLWREIRDLGPAAPADPGSCLLGPFLVCP